MADFPTSIINAALSTALYPKDLSISIPKSQAFLKKTALAQQITKSWQPASIIKDFGGDYVAGDELRNMPSLIGGIRFTLSLMLKLQASEDFDRLLFISPFSGLRHASR